MSMRIQGNLSMYFCIDYFICIYMCAWYFVVIYPIFTFRSENEGNTEEKIEELQNQIEEHDAVCYVR